MFDEKIKFTEDAHINPDKMLLYFNCGKRNISLLASYKLYIDHNNHLFFTRTIYQ